MAFELRQKTLEALRSSTKGKITFDPNWTLRGEDIMAGYAEHRESEPCSPPAQSHFLDSGYSSPEPSEDTPVPVSTPTSVAETPAPSPSRAAAVSRSISELEKLRRVKSKMALRRRELALAKLTATTAAEVSEQLRRSEQMVAEKNRYIRDMTGGDLKNQPGTTCNEQRQQREVRKPEVVEAELQVESKVELSVVYEEILLVAENGQPPSSLSSSTSQEEQPPSLRAEVVQEAPETETKLQEMECEMEPEATESPNTGVQTGAEVATLKWSQELQEAAARFTRSFEELACTKDVATKKLKTELQKAATIPVSQIAGHSTSQLREVFHKVDRLLSGQEVEMCRSTVSTSQHPQGLHFVVSKLAEKFVKQGEEEVASHHEAAFPIAAVASAVWRRHPLVGDLILAHLHKKCPYAVPHYPERPDGASEEEYRRTLGYRVYEDSEVEGQDCFLKRMSGMIRLYAAMILLQPLPHGPEHGWRWLAQMVNMEPRVEVTATLLLDFLEVCGHALVRLYQGQFWKLLLLLDQEYLPRIEAVTSSDRMGSVMRLKKFLTVSLQSRQIGPPTGQLSVNF